MRKIITGLGLAMSVITLSGCVSPPAPAPVAVAAPLPPSVAGLPAVGAPVALVPPPPTPTIRHHSVRMAHPVIHHHVVHRYYSARASYTPQCGSTEHPCTVEHVTVPIR
jgi:hypothetical protein